jgi:hypothetical protein
LVTLFITTSMTRILRIFLNPFTAVISVFLISILLIKPWGNYPVNDDWDFMVHTINFSHGDLIKNALIDSSFVLQGFIGVLWGSVFGISFISMRVLTIIFALLSLFGVYKISQHLKLNRVITFMVLVAVAFNPFFYSSSLTYMTEIYFLCFMIWSVYYFLLYIKSASYQHLILAVLISSASVLIRQFGVVTLLAYLAYLFLCFIFDKNKKVASHFLFTLILLAISFFVIYRWPQYTLPGSAKPFIERLSNLLTYHNLVTQLLRLPSFLPYLGFFLSPFLISFLCRQKKIVTGVICLVSLPLLFPIYNLDIFSLGNTVHVEGLYTKSDYAQGMSLFDNIVFKVALSYYLAVALTCLLFLSIKLFKRFAIKLETDRVLLLLGLTSIFMFLCVVVIPDYFDRYFINFFVLAIILSGYLSNGTFKETEIKPLLTLLPLILFSFLITQDYYAAKNEKLSQALTLHQSKNLRTRLFLDGAYTRWLYVSPKNNSPSIKSSLPPGLKYNCFVESFSTTSDTSRFVYALLSKVENSRKMQNIFPRVSIVDADKTATVLRIENYPKRVTAQKEYHSLLYNLIGKNSYVGSFCVEEKPIPKTAI